MKKGAYDLGRKAVYYIVVVIIIAVLFVYIMNNFREYRITMLSTLDKATDFAMVNNIVICVSQKDADTGKMYLGKIDPAKLNKDSLTKCLGGNPPYSDKSVKIKIGKDEIITQEPYFEYTKYERTVILEDKEKTLEINIEKYPLVR